MLEAFLHLLTVLYDQAAGGSNGGIRPKEAKIISTLSDASNGYAPRILRVINESHMHSVPRGSETHFKVSLVGSIFGF